MTTNPERLWVYTWIDGSRRATEAMSALVRREDQEEYVHVDVAAEQTAAALRGEAHEVAALRAEVEALRTLARRAADLLRPSFRLTVDGRDTPPNALVADIDAALSAKGVG